MRGQRVGHLAVAGAPAEAVVEVRQGEEVDGRVGPTIAIKFRSFLSDHRKLKNHDSENITFDMSVLDKIFIVILNSLVIQFKESKEKESSCNFIIHKISSNIIVYKALIFLRLREHP